MSVEVPVPKDSLLGGYVVRGAFADCYSVQVEGLVTLPALIEAFYTTPLFRLERRLLAWALKLRSTDAQARQLAEGSADRFSAWRVEGRSDDEILLDAGQTRSWLSVSPADGAGRTTLFFGSAVVPLRPGGGFGLAFHALLGFHRLYSRLLLAAAARRVLALRAARGAA